MPRPRVVKCVPVAVCLVAVWLVVAAAVASATGLNACNDPVASGALFGKQIVVSTAVSYAYSVAVGDFNGDGDLDLASASIKDNKIAWYKNLTPPPQCCQAQPAFPGYKDLCTNVTDKPTCLGLASGFGKTCVWTCGECDAIAGDGQYQKFCLGHQSSTSCRGANSTCYWVPAY